MSPKELVKQGEMEHELGGYFIVAGGERVLRMQVRGQHAMLFMLYCQASIVLPLLVLACACISRSVSVQLSQVLSSAPWTGGAAAWLPGVPVPQELQDLRQGVHRARHSDALSGRGPLHGGELYRHRAPAPLCIKL